MLKLSQFTFKRVSTGAYYVTYETSGTFSLYGARIDDMTLIDATRNAEEPKQKDLKRLRDEIKRKCGAKLKQNNNW